MTGKIRKHDMAIRAGPHFCDRHPPAYRFADCDCEKKVKCAVQGCNNNGTQTGLFEVELRRKE